MTQVSARLMYKGLSLSLCVADILKGYVDEDDVALIWAGTRADTDYDWMRVLMHYCEMYWQADPERARGIVVRLLARDAIEQPRTFLLPQEPLNIADGHWLNVWTYPRDLITHDTQACEVCV